VLGIMAWAVFDSMPPQHIFQPCFIRRAPQKNLSEKVDVAGVLAYKTILVDMDFRCSNSVAALAVLMGSGVCAWFAPAAWAGERIEFSAPAVPLSVPRPEVEVREPAKMIGSGVATEGIMDGTLMPVSSEYVLVKPRNKDKDDWSLDARLDNDPSRRDADDLFTERQDSTRETNSNNLNTKPGLNPATPGNLLQQRNESALDGSQADSKFGAWTGLDRDNSRFGAWSGADRNNPRFAGRNGMGGEDSKFETRNGFDREHSKYGTQNGTDKDYTRSNDRLGGAFSSGKDDSFLTKAFGREAPGMPRLDPIQPTPSMSDGGTLSGGVFGEHMNDPAFGQDSSRAPAFAPGYSGFAPLDDGQSRQVGGLVGPGQASFRAWEQPGVPPPQTSRSFSNPDQFNNSRVAPPNRGAILSMPQRPGDPH
jgi:hypothetical protein